MTALNQVPAIEGWFTTEPRPGLLGTRCVQCGTFHFPREDVRCRNPHCGGTQLEEVRLSDRGKVWSLTVNHYAPPPPYVAADTFEPFGVVAVELAEEQMVVLGQLARGTDPATLSIGDEVELLIEPLYEDTENQYLVWKWKPVSAS